MKATEEKEKKKKEMKENFLFEKVKEVLEKVLKMQKALKNELKEKN